MTADDIRNDEELLVVEDQLRRAESALTTIENEVRPINQRTFDVIAQPYVETIEKLRQLVSGYRKTQKKQN